MNREDFELLSLAAKPCGIKIISIQHGKLNVTIDSKKNFHWNPLTDDGTALQLAVKLKMSIGVGVAWCNSITESAYEEPCDYAATRRAIVKVAAEIGKAMP